MLQAQERMGYDIRSLDLRVGRIEASMGVRAVSDSSDSDDAILVEPGHCFILFLFDLT